MRFTNIQFAETERVTVSIRNANASLAILDGMPVFSCNFNRVTTDTTAGTTSLNALGVDVRTHSTVEGTSLSSQIVGIAKVNNTRVANATGLVAGDFGEAVCYGFTDAIVVRRTRATSTDSWAAAVSFGAGDQLVPETGNNYLTWSATLAIGAGNVAFVAGESQAALASFSSSLNTAFVTATAETVRMKVFVNRM